MKNTLSDVIIAYEIKIIMGYSLGNSKFENNLSHGNVASQLLKFAMPFIISNIIQSLYNVVDLVVVGWFGNDASVAAVNNGSQLTFLATCFAIGISVGATVLIGQYLGAGDRESLRKTIGTLFVTLAVLAVVATVLMVVLKDALLKLIGVPAEAFEEASDYLFVTALGTIFIFGYNALSAVMRGMGDSKRPLIFVAIACFTNIGLDLLFVAVFKMAALGAAIATVIAQGISMILCIIYLGRNDFIFDFKKLSSYKVDIDNFKMLVKVGLPTMIQQVSTNLSFLFLVSLANGMGVAASSAVGIVGKFNGFAILPAIAVSSAISAMCAQNIGADQTERAVKTMRTGMLLAYAITIPIFIITKLFPSQILSLFGNNPDIIAEGVNYIDFFSLDYLLVPLFFCMNGIFIGSGHTTFSLVTNLICAVLVRAPAAWFFSTYVVGGMRGLGLGAPASTFVSCIFVIVFFISGRWKKRVIIKQNG